LQITKLQKLQGQAALISVSSDKGILTGQEAVAGKVGGIPLFKIY